MATKVIPNSINYADMKPESLDTDIRLSKFVPTATITKAKPNEMIKFFLTGQGFFDPYSAYFKFTVDVSDFSDGEIRTLDRSAHSFISRMIIKVNGVELERIENYDIVAAMINDMIYSPEQNSIHAWEGFPTHTLETTDVTYGLTSANQIDGVGNRPYSADANSNTPVIAAAQVNVARRLLQQLNSQGASPFTHRYIGEVQFSNDTDSLATGASSDHGVCDTVYFTDATYAAENIGLTPRQALDTVEDSSMYPLDYAWHIDGKRKSGFGVTANGGNGRQVKALGTRKMTFIIPIYSGVLGVLMPDKKLLPLGLMPLEIEVTLNQHALYSNLAGGSRDYTITDFNLYSHMVFFESEIHKQLEYQTAEHGLFIYGNSFVSGPTLAIQGKNLPTNAQLSVNLKSVNSVHLIFMYTHYLTRPHARKLHFVSHNIKKLQIRNGQNLIPSYAIEGNSGSSKEGDYTPFMLELYKAYNKLHDPKTDGAIQAYNFCGDAYNGQFDPLPLKQDISTPAAAINHLARVINKQSGVGRCQYGVSLEGEELGENKNMITGRKVEYPFMVEMYGTKSSAAESYMIPFLRSDFVVYVRPDIQVSVLGK